MSHFLKNLIPDEAIVVETSQSKQIEARKNMEELHRYSLFEKHIKFRGADGRTFDYVDEKGKYISHYVSQFSSIINDNLEPGVAVLVRLLHLKGYLTMGSCQGHEDSPFRWVSLAFPERSQLDDFMKMVDKFELPITWYENFLNFREKNKTFDDNSYQVSFTWNQYNPISRSLESLREQGYSEDELTIYLNIMYSRDHKKYHLVKMVIASKMGDKSFFDSWKWKRMYKKREEVTENLVEALDQCDFVNI